MRLCDLKEGEYAYTATDQYLITRHKDNFWYCADSLKTKVISDRVLNRGDFIISKARPILIRESIGGHYTSRYIREGEYVCSTIYTAGGGCYKKILILFDGHYWGASKDGNLLNRIPFNSKLLSGNYELYKIDYIEGEKMEHDTNEFTHLVLNVKVGNISKHISRESALEFIKKQLEVNTRQTFHIFKLTDKVVPPEIDVTKFLQKVED